MLVGLVLTQSLSVCSRNVVNLTSWKSKRGRRQNRNEEAPSRASGIDHSIAGSRQQVAGRQCACMHACIDGVLLCTVHARTDGGIKGLAGATRRAADRQRHGTCMQGTRTTQRRAASLSAVPISYGLDPVRRKGGLYLTDDDPSWRPRLGSSPLAGVCLPACPLDGPEEDDGWGVAMASR